MTKITFVVGNSVQLETAIAVANELEAEYQYFDIRPASIVTEVPSFTSHNVGVSVSRVAGIAKSVWTTNDLLVLPQDVGLLQRVLRHRALKCGATVVLMPDGIVGSIETSTGGRLHKAAKWLTRRLAVSIGLDRDTSTRMGGSFPDFILSWGPGWNKVFPVGEATQIVITGSPRAVKFSNLPETPNSNNILVCSQPLWIPSWSRGHVDDWYLFLYEILEYFPKGRVRVRLHPAELGSNIVPPGIRDLAVQNSLEEDLEWSSFVISPFSTVLVEALAANRSPISLIPDTSIQSNLDHYPIFSTQGLPSAKWNINDLVRQMRTPHKYEKLREDFMSGGAHAAKVTASALQSILNKSIKN